jgi:hypothetical protein
LGSTASAIELTIDGSSNITASVPPLPIPIDNSPEQRDEEMSNKQVFGISSTLSPSNPYYFAKNTNVSASSINATSSSSSVSSGRRSSATPVELQSSANKASRNGGRAVPLARAASSGASFRQRSDYPANKTTNASQSTQNLTGQIAHVSSHNTPALFPLAPPPKSSKRRPATAVAIGSKPSGIAAPRTSVDSISGTFTAVSHSDHVQFATENKQRQPSFSVTSPKHSDMIRKYFKTKNGKRHHAFPSKRAPYPRSYDSTAIDQYVSVSSVSLSIPVDENRMRKRSDERANS